MRLLLTGASGFVAPFVARAVRAAFGADVAMGGLAQAPGEQPDIGPIAAVELGDTASIEAAFAAFRPTHVVHLGGVSGYAAAEGAMETAWDVNVLGALRCAQALHRVTPDGVFLFVSSAQVYGEKSAGPLAETAPPAPASVYAATKAAAELALQQMARRGLKVVRFRPFNHTGPEQTEGFVVPRFAAQIARIESGRQAPVMKVGNLGARRDFLDVRDVARAYVAALQRAPALPQDSVFNLASGRAESIQWILDRLVAMSRAPVTVETDPALVRADDGSLLLGDASAAAHALGWRPAIPLEQTLEDVLDYWRARV